MANHVMLDLETLGTSNNAMIISIGAVIFDTDECRVRNAPFYAVIAPLGNTGDMDVDTVMWWMKQNDEVREEITEQSVHHMTMPIALGAFTEYCNRLNVEKIWGNGAGFDNVILRNAYTRTNRVSPWQGKFAGHRMDMCYRTMKAMFPDVPRPPFEGDAHNALDDAKNQAQHLCDILQHIKR